MLLYTRKGAPIPKDRALLDKHQLTNDVGDDDIEDTDDEKKGSSSWTV